VGTREDARYGANGGVAARRSGGQGAHAPRCTARGRRPAVEAPPPSRRRTPGALLRTALVRGALRRAAVRRARARRHSAVRPNTPGPPPMSDGLEIGIVCYPSLGG